jgi:hypothetical protein
MDLYFKNTQYPLVPFQGTNTVLDEAQADFLKEHFLDFKLALYSKFISSPPLVYLDKLHTTNSEVVVEFAVRVKFLEEEIYTNAGTISLNFDFNAFNFSEFARAHFDSADVVDLDSRISSLDGHVSFKNLHSWNAVFDVPLNLTESKLLLEPSTISVLGNHIVDSISCQSAKPLILQTLAEPYNAISTPVTGKVNFIGGANCVISLQNSNNTLTIAAVRNANGSNEEACGIWKDKIPGAEEKDVLCNEAIYSLGGAYPDDSGNIVISGNYPISVSSLTREQLPEKFQNHLGSNYAHIDKFIYVGVPTRALEGACSPVDPEVCPPA